MMPTPKQEKKKHEKREIERVPTDDLVHSIREDLELERQRREQEQAEKKD
jgi:hypothetical protein